MPKKIEMWVSKDGSESSHELTALLLDLQLAHETAPRDMMVPGKLSKPIEEALAELEEFYARHKREKRTRQFDPPG